MRSHFLRVVGVQHPSGFILLVSCVAEAAALASVPGAGPQRRAVPLQQHSDTTVNNRGRRCTQSGGRHVSQGHTYVRGALLVGSLRRGRAQGIWLAARRNLAARLLKPPPAPTLGGRRVRVVGHALVFVWGEGKKKGLCSCLEISRCVRPDLENHDELSSPSLCTKNIGILFSLI